MPDLNKQTIIDLFASTESGSHKRKNTPTAYKPLAALYSTKDAAKPEKLSGHTLVYDKDSVRIKLMNGDTEKDSLKLAEIVAIYKKVIELEVPDHRDVLKLKEWRDIYDVTDQSFNFKASDAASAASVSLPAVSCRGCGLILPLSMMHVDHQGPKANSYNGFLKVMKFFGLMHKASTGYKAGKSAAHRITFANSANYTPQGDFWNGKGVIFLTIIEEIGIRAAVMNTCVNSLLNLAPRCGRCNTGKGAKHASGIRKETGYDAAKIKTHHSWYLS